MPTASAMKDAAESLAQRMARPQRHRLLQGYPAVPLMGPAMSADSRTRQLDGALERPRGVSEPPVIEIDRSRKLIVGVIPHTMCKPKRHGCGFCTFGQSQYRRGQMNLSMRTLPEHIDQVLRHEGHDFSGRKVEALYFGGGTANLTPVGDLEHAFARLAACLDLRDAELTLEGVPSLFLSRFSAALRWLGRLPVRRTRVSMGVQTFDPLQLRRMGREHFGDAALIGRVVREAHERGIGSSGDFLFNLPHQTRAQMLGDLAQAVAIGFEQICIYHLVLYEGLGTPWSRDPQLLAALPSMSEALDNWLALREALLAAGYVQTTLTNFERADINKSDRRFRYEELSFSPAEVDGLGIGPLSISTFIDFDRRRAVKLFRGLDEREGLFFAYDPVDLELLYLTRSLPRMRWSAVEYRQHFGAELEDDHREVVRAIVDAALVERRGTDLQVTPRGMFFADSIAGLLAERRVEELRAGARAVGMSTHQFIAEHHMG
jgi:coproporphyrinogen III oxidase-like Fe-S oxidoreductase